MRDGNYNERQRYLVMNWMSEVMMWEQRSNAISGMQINENTYIKASWFTERACEWKCLRNEKDKSMERRTENGVLRLNKVWVSQSWVKSKQLLLAAGRADPSREGSWARRWNLTISRVVRPRAYVIEWNQEGREREGDENPVGQLSAASCTQRGRRRY